MEFGKTIGDSFEYAKEGLVGKWAKWILLHYQLHYIPPDHWVCNADIPRSGSLHRNLMNGEECL